MKTLKFALAGALAVVAVFGVVQFANVRGQIAQQERAIDASTEEVVVMGWCSDHTREAAIWALERGIDVATDEGARRACYGAYRAMQAER